MKAMNSFVGGICLLVMPSIVPAAVVLEGGLHTGGDELASAVYTDGSTSSIKAGALLSFAVGPSFDLSPNLEGRVTLGVKVDEINASNGNVTFIRYPIDVLLMSKLGEWRIGGGITYHLSPKLDGGGVASNISADFENALGLLASIERDFGVFYFGGRITLIDYKTIPSMTVSNATINGNSVGIVAGIRF
ncbi:MAG: hypothetical protein HY080_01405 [Gammaproteobacteria bacterium]|nr:hypothetical protein [Gammaproteobacteria bacterium]